MRGFMGSSKDYAADTLKTKKPRLARPRKARLPKDLMGKVATMPKVTAIKVKPISAKKSRKNLMG